MQNLSLILLLLLLPLHPCLAQNIAIDSFYTQGSTWTEYRNENNGQGYRSDNGYKFKIGNDTLIGNISYHLLYMESIGEAAAQLFLSPNYVYGIDTNDFKYQLVGALRVSSKKLYFYTLDSATLYTYAQFYDSLNCAYDSSFNNFTEKLLYDFNPHNIGDSIRSMPIQSIDSVQLSNGIFVKRYHFNFAFEYYFIEGIGSSAGILNIIPYEYYYTFHALCYNAPQFSYHFADSSLPGVLDPSCFDITTSVNTVQHTVRDLNFYPDPLSTDLLTIQCNNKEDINSIQVFDISGKLISTFSHPFATYELHLVLNKGTYFLRAQFKDGTNITKPLIKL